MEEVTMGKTGWWGSCACFIQRAETLALVLVAGACSANDPSDAVVPGPSGAKLEFAACPHDLPGETPGRDCAVTTVPLRWDDPEGPSIELLVARYPSATPGNGQLWLLDGGPGGTGAVYMQPEILRLYTSLGLDVYIPQHRGTGHSTPLGCTAPDDLHGCGEELLDTWGDGLQGFHSVEAGRDVGHLVTRSRRPGERVFVFGLSYGSYWAQRYLQSFPKQADGVILEGVLPLDQPLWEGDVPADAAARSIFQACREDADCAAAFGSRDPEDVARAVLAAAEDPERRCFGADGADRVTLEAVLSLLIAADVAHLVPGLLRRLDRCSAQDQKELLAVVDFFAGLPDVDPAVDNQVLGNHVVRTDLMASLAAFPLEKQLAERKPLVFWSGAASVEALDAVVAGWPVNYSPATTELPASLPPILLMNGGLDIQTPSVWARELAPKLGGTLVEFPYAGHGVDVSLASPLTANDASCSLGILRGFVTHPGGSVDGRCAATAYTPDVAGHSATNQYLASRFYGEDTPLLGADDAAPAAKRLEPRSLDLRLTTAERTLRERLARAAHGRVRP
jgi:pimeloyl-ACP methyl ester carboxylesterase